MVVEPRTEVPRRDERDREATSGRVVRRADDRDVVREVADRRVDAPAERGEDRLVVGTVHQRYQRDSPPVSFPVLWWGSEQPGGSGHQQWPWLVSLPARPANCPFGFVCRAGRHAGFVPTHLQEQREH
jgi:hypothetical protein